MKKTTKRLFIGTGAVIGVLILIFGAMIFRYISVAKTMSPMPTKLVVNGVYSVNDTFVNLYIIRDRNTLIAIDAGNDAKNTGQELQKLNIDPLAVSAVFLTHTDSDHVDGIKLFKNARIYISGLEENLLNGTTHLMFVFHNRIDRDYIKLKDNQVVNAGGIRVKCILTPGHTPGSMCFLVNDRYLFTGDTLSLKNGEADLFYDLFNMDTETEKTSFLKIMSLENAGYIFTAHNGYTADYAKAFKKWNR